MTNYNCYLFGHLVAVYADYPSALAWSREHEGNGHPRIEAVSPYFSSDCCSECRLDCGTESSYVHKTNVISEAEHEEDLSIEVLERLHRMYTNSMLSYIADTEILKVKYLEVKDFSEKRNIEHTIRFNLKFVEVLQKLMKETSDKMKGSDS